MPDGLMRLVLGGVLFLHGIAHGGAIGALWWVANRPGVDTGGWEAARLWAAPGVDASAANAVAIAFWITAMVAFVIAAFGFWGIVVPGEWWRPAAVAGALVSLLGIVLFAGTWPVFNMVAAVAVNIGVLAVVFGLGWGVAPTSAQ